MSLHYLSNDLFGQIIVFLAAHHHATLFITLMLMIAAAYVFALGKCEARHTEKWTFALLVAAVVLGASPMAREAHGTYLISEPFMELANQWAYYQPDYQIDTSTIYQLHEADDAHPSAIRSGRYASSPAKEGWADTPTGQIKGQIADPQGQLTQVKHGEPGSDLVELTYTIGDVEHKATVRLSDDQFFYLWHTIVDKPLPLSVLDSGDFVIDNYHQPINQK